jgi:hypothetical protein
VSSLRRNKASSLALALAASAVVALVPLQSAGADEAAAAPCNAWDIDYALAANVQLSDTMMGAGDGVYRIGPGTMTLRFQNVGGQPGGVVKMTAYDMKDTFTVDAKALFGGTKVTNDTHTTVTYNVCGVAAEGALRERVVRWSTLVNGMHTDGKVTCDGSFCGRFGAPPRGTSDVHTTAHPVVFKPLELSQDLHTFTMGWSVTAKSTTPSQTSKIALAGRETKRTCVAVKPCP